MKVKDVVLLYVIFCIAGTLLEWGYGAYWDWLGTAPWLYADSPLRYTSLEGIPLWGAGGIICAVIFRAFQGRRWKTLAWLIAPVVLAALWILVFEVAVK